MITKQATTEYIKVLKDCEEIKAEDGGRVLGDAI